MSNSKRDPQSSIETYHAKASQIPQELAASHGLSLLAFRTILTSGHEPRSVEWICEDLDRTGSWPETGELVTEDVRETVFSCITAGWLRIVDEQAIREIGHYLEGSGALTPLGGLPEIGSVDVTVGGAAICQEFAAALEALRNRYYAELGIPLQPEPLYQHVIGSSDQFFCLTSDAAERLLSEAAWFYAEQGLQVSAAPVLTLIGPWRRVWWERYPSAYQVEVSATRAADLDALRSAVSFVAQPDSSRRSEINTHWAQVLLQFGVSAAELAVLVRFAFGSLPLEMAAESAMGFSNRAGLVSVSTQDCREGIASCLRKGWLREIDGPALAELENDLRQDPALGPIEPLPDIGHIDLSREGARLYKDVHRELYGSGVLLHVAPGPATPPPDRTAYSDAVYRHQVSLERFYYRDEQAAAAARKEFLAPSGPRGVCSVGDPFPIGPWCVHWWERFEKGAYIDVRRS
jgi:hypothetical protein